LNAGGIDHPRLGIVRKVPKEMSITRFRYAVILPSLVAGLVLSLAAGSALADDDIDWATALRAYYTAEVVYERCGFSASWEQLSALSESIEDAEREAGLQRAGLHEAGDRGRRLKRRAGLLRGERPPPDDARYSRVADATA